VTTNCRHAYREGPSLGLAALPGAPLCASSPCPAGVLWQILSEQLEVKNKGTSDISPTFSLLKYKEFNKIMRAVSSRITGFCNGIRQIHEIAVLNSQFHQRTLPARKIYLLVLAPILW
jgi:hypothetical protein